MEIQTTTGRVRLPHKSAIREWRRGLGLTQADLAEALGLTATNQVVGKIERQPGYLEHTLHGYTRKLLESLLCGAVTIGQLRAWCAEDLPPIPAPIDPTVYGVSRATAIAWSYNPTAIPTPARLLCRVIATNMTEAVA